MIAPAAASRSSPLASGLYEGFVRHRRFTPRAHAFRFPLYMLYLDLAEIGRVFLRSRLWSTTGLAPLEFRRADYLGDPAAPLDDAVRDLVEARTGARPRGAIRLLTQGRCFGYCFNPVSFYYCFDPEGRSVEAIVAEITNTPWKERHTHVLPAARSVGVGPQLRFRFSKEFHVSPFMPMEQDYDWTFRPPTPGRPIAVHMINLERDAPVFDATLVLRRREATAAELRRALLRRPAMAASVIARIYLEAARLRLKGVRPYAHPGAARAPQERRA